MSHGGFGSGSRGARAGRAVILPRRAPRLDVFRFRQPCRHAERRSVDRAAPIRAAVEQQAAARDPRARSRYRRAALASAGAVGSSTSTGTRLRPMLLPSRPASAFDIVSCSARPTSRYGLTGLIPGSDTWRLP